MSAIERLFKCSLGKWVSVMERIFTPTVRVNISVWRGYFWENVSAMERLFKPRVRVNISVMERLFKPTVWENVSVMGRLFKPTVRGKILGPLWRGYLSLQSCVRYGTK